ncbi:MAG: YggT family protein [Tepidiformaceae bacterium]
MNHQVAQIFTGFLYLLMFAVIARSLLSWFPINQDGQLAYLLRRITDPLIEPFRRIMPRMGMFDLSPMVVVIVLYLMITVVNQAATS